MTFFESLEHFLGGGIAGAIILALVTAWINRRKATAEADKLQAETVELATQGAFDRLLKSNTYLQDRLAHMDAELIESHAQKDELAGRIEKLELKIDTMERERETLLCENRELRGKVDVLQQKYDVLKRAVVGAFDLLIEKFGNHEDKFVDVATVQKDLQEAKRSLPGTGPLGR